MQREEEGEEEQTEGQAYHLRPLRAKGPRIAAFLHLRILLGMRMTEDPKHRKIHTNVGPMYLNPSESRHMRKRANGIYEPAKTALVRQFVKPGMVFVDVGANKGWFSCLASGLVGSSGHVFAYEPIETNFRWLKKTAGFRENMTCRPLAIGDCDGTTVFNLAPRSGGHTFMQRPAWESGRVVVPIARLESEFGNDQLDAVKIDVESAELRVLSGMDQLLRRERQQTQWKQKKKDRPWLSRRLRCKGTQYHSKQNTKEGKKMRSRNAITRTLAAFALLTVTLFADVALVTPINDVALAASGTSTSDAIKVQYIKGVDGQKLNPNGSISAQINVAGSGTVKVEFLCSNDSTDGTDGNFVVPTNTSGATIEGLTAGNTLRPVTLPVCGWIKVRITETGGADTATVKVTLAVQ